MQINQDPQVETKFQSYPEAVVNKLRALRSLILETAAGIDHIKSIEETLKWGEPSYLAKKGSTIRIDWKTKAPHQYAMYFSCQTSLVPTFKILYGGLFQYEKDRALLFDMDETLPLKEVKECIEIALQYHLVKNLPLLGK